MTAISRGVDGHLPPRRRRPSATPTSSIRVGDRPRVRSLRRGPLRALRFDRRLAWRCRRPARSARRLQRGLGQRVLVDGARRCRSTAIRSDHDATRAISRSTWRADDPTGRRLVLGRLRSKRSCGIVFDSTNEPGDTASLGFTPIFTVMTGAEVATDALTSIFPFITGLRAANPGSVAAINDPAQPARTSTARDDFGAGETNYGGDPQRPAASTATSCSTLRANRLCSRSPFGNDDAATSSAIACSCASTTTRPRR